MDTVHDPIAEALDHLRLASRTLDLLIEDRLSTAMRTTHPLAPTALIDAALGYGAALRDHGAALDQWKREHPEEYFASPAKTLRGWERIVLPQVTRASAAAHRLMMVAERLHNEQLLEMARAEGLGEATAPASAAR